MNNFPRPGKCDCPTQKDANGRLCGKRASLQKVGGYHPNCEALEKTQAVLEANPELPISEAILEAQNLGYIRDGRRRTSSPDPFTDEQSQFVKDVLKSGIRPEDIFFDSLGRAFLKRPGGGADFITRELANRVTPKVPKLGFPLRPSFDQDHRSHDLITREIEAAKKGSDLILERRNSAKRAAQSQSTGRRTAPLGLGF